MTRLSSLLVRAFTALPGLRPAPLDVGDATALPLVLRLCRDGAEAFLDVGANRGLYALAVAGTCPQCRVVAYEPTPRLAYQLRQRGQECGVQVVEAAVGAAEGRAMFYRSQSRDEESTLLLDRAYQLPDVIAIEVPVVSLDGEVRRLGCHPERTVVKIDVEGAEDAVLAGATALFASEAEIVMEFLGRSIEGGILERVITTTGRRLSYLHPDRIIPITSTADFLAVQDLRAWNFWLSRR